MEDTISEIAFWTLLVAVFVYIMFKGIRRHS